MSAADLDLGILTNCPAIKARVEEICSEFQYAKECWDDVEPFFSIQQKFKLIVAYLTSPEGTLAPTELAQIVRHSSADAFLICVTDEPLSKDAAAFARKSGANIILLRHEVLQTGKLEFVCSQVIRSRFLPIKPSDLVSTDPIPLDLYHLLPQRRKFLRMLDAGDQIDPKKLEKAIEAREIYIERVDATRFGQYVSETPDKSAFGIEKRCRGKFLALFSEFSELVYQVSDQSAQSSFGEGQTLINGCRVLCSELLGALAEGGEAWKTVNNSAIGEFGSIERAPAVAAYAGIFALQIGLDKIDELMLAALLSDIGMLFLPTSITRKIRNDAAATLTEDELKNYHQYPTTSLEIILSRKLSIPEKLRLWITASHERADGKGFPKGLTLDKLPLETRLIAFCRSFDQRTLLKLGRPRVDPTAALKEMLTASESVDQYGSDLIQKLTQAIGLESVSNGPAA